MIHVGLLKIDLHIQDARSLKEKRVILRRIKDRVRNLFNVSIAEVDNHDKWQLASIGISCVSNDKKHIDSTLNSVKNFCEKEKCVLITDYRLEII